MYGNIYKKTFSFFVLFLLLFSPFIAHSQKITISGTIRDNQSHGILGVIVYLNSSSDGVNWIGNKTVTDSSGFYQFDKLDIGLIHQITPVKNNYLFSPSTVKIENLRENKILDFTTSANSIKKFSISGYAKDSASKPIKDVIIYLNGKTVEVMNESRILTDENGFYKFDNLDSNGNYFINPSKAGYTFTPNSRTFDNLSENKTQDFIGTKYFTQEYIISGYIRDKNSLPLLGVKIMLTGPDYSSFAVMAMTDSNGYYKFDRLMLGKYFTITPSKDGYLFDPISKTYEILNENKKQDFLALLDTIPRYSISGYVKDKDGKGTANVQLSLDGIILSTMGPRTTTDNSGYYKFDKVKAGISYILTPYQLGYRFEPASRIFENLNENKTQDFICAKLPENITISGYIKEKDSKPIEGAIVYLFGSVPPENKTVTDANGFYKFEKLMTGQSFKMYVSKEGYTFDPPSFGFENVYENKTRDFIGKKFTFYTVEGRITDNSGAGINRVSMILSGDRYNRAITDSAGYYKIYSIEGGLNYVLTPEKYGYTFDPQLKSFGNLNESKIQNFIGTQKPVVRRIISGYIKDKSFKGIEGVLVNIVSNDRLYSVIEFEELQLCIKTDASGFYKFDEAEDGRSYMISVEKTGFSFTPRYAVLENINGNKSQDFLASPVVLYSISGYIGIKSEIRGLPGATVISGGEKYTKTLTDSTGFYKLDSLESGKLYTIIPSKRGYKFEPNYKIFENLDKNEKQDFNAISIPAANYPICGFIEDNNNNRMSNVAVIISGDMEQTVQTDENGFFIFENAEEGKNYTITPSKEGYNFYPPGIFLNNLDECKTLNNVGSRIVQTEVSQTKNYLPKEMILHQNYPNPFNPSTTLEYGLTNPGEVKLKVFDLLGREVYTLIDEFQSAGFHTMQFNPKNLGSGRYIIRLQSGNSVKSVFITLLK